MRAAAQQVDRDFFPLFVTLRSRTTPSERQERPPETNGRMASSFAGTFRAGRLIGVLGIRPVHYVFEEAVCRRWLRATDCHGGAGRGDRHHQVHSGSPKQPECAQGAAFLGPRMYVDFSDDAQYSAKLKDLAREIHGAPAVVKPALGENPFKGEVIASASTWRYAAR